MYTLTKDDIKALRKADTLCPDYYQGKSALRILRDHKSTKDGGRVEYPEVALDVSSNFTVYKTADAPDGYGGNEYDAKPSRCFAHVSAHYEVGQYIVDTLREGDQIGLEWSANVSNGYMWNIRCAHPQYEGQRIYHDTCVLRIRRGNKDYTVKLADSHCPDNSARMMRFS